MDTVNDEDLDAPSLHDLAVDTLGGESTIMPISIDIVDSNEVDLGDDVMPEELSPVIPTPSTFMLDAVEEVPSTSKTPSPRRKRNQKGKFMSKQNGTPTQMERREKDRKRKHFDRNLKIFDKLTNASVGAESLAYFCLIKRENGEVHYTGTDDFIKKFKENESLLDFKDGMIETRRESLLLKLNKSTVKKQAVEPSPLKAPEQFSFLPGIGLGESQRKELGEAFVSGENAIALDKDRIADIKKRIWVRKNRVNPKERVETRGRGRGRGQGRGRKKGTESNK
ncbi:uncharacterized protein LOC134718891 [Mytilus trossulus]|uniref:uncharacterized protein LOC134718891 n=1 Tax=Mytilus trossulus TaxID=6551 RepID=UPI003004E470